MENETACAIGEVHSYATARAFLFAALARFFCLGFFLVRPEVPREIFPRFER
jgi:hypothetical protein